MAVPFVLYSEPTGVFGEGANVAEMAEEAHRRYAEIMRDVEFMIEDHSTSSTQHLVPETSQDVTLLPDCTKVDQVN